MSGKQQEDQGWLEQVSASTYPLTLKKKKSLQKSWDAGTLSPPSPLSQALLYLMHT